MAESYFVWQELGALVFYSYENGKTAEILTFLLSEK